ncbi:MAG: pentapeptide repeat-containing protein [Gloeocapsa sp. UFS-A4-WI-NPMV-4B04]|jgi:uncharacterized protein YjbI with pentapeptide repeats/energy-coupling factor transporter ATP-binding protein EcfA2|nr:pentapeptide repeat-containing protein [Gloeocapsa sp. UFS-A4-WI-NPMV-4B04]
MIRDVLVVGINSYQFPGLHNLQAPAVDAEAIAKMLEEYGDFNVWRLPEAIRKEDRKPYVGANLNVTLARLQDELVRLFKPEGRSIPDTALFYFSGHGLRQTQGIQEGFLATSDANPDTRFYGLSLQWLRRLLQESPIKQQIVWLDCCHSGELLNFNEADPGVQGNGRDRCFIAASREFELAYQDLSDRYSVLTKVLLKGLDPTRESERWITNHSLTDYLNHYLRGATQRPTCSNFGEPINLTRTWKIVQQEPTQDTAPAICPYKGLEYFDCNEEDPKYFYGREELIDQLLDKLRQSNFLAIVGASGSGKSSVLRAGVIHQLKLGRKLAGSEQWQIYIMVPGERPLQNLVSVFVEPNLSKLDRAEQLGKAEGLLKAGADGLRRLVQSSESERVVLVVDQFEEVFTLCQDEVERKQFISCLLGALGKVGNKLYLIIAMRADFFSKCIEQEYSGLADKIKDDLVPLSLMNQEQLQQAIVKPAQLVNLDIEPELVQEMLRDVEGSPGTLPLLQYTLKELWQRRSNNRLQLTTYSQLGGISGTLDQRATEIFSKLPPQQQEAVKHIFLCLTQLGEGTEDTRRRVLKRDLITAKHPEALIDEVIQELADKKNRLIITSELVEKGVAAERVTVVDVAHEALIRNWNLLRQWLNESRDYLRQQRKIETAALDWKDKQNDSRTDANDYLLQGRRLREVKEFQKEQSERFPLSRLASEFIKKSDHYRKTNQLKIIGGVLIIPLIAAVFISSLVYREVRIRQYWDTVNKTQGKAYNATRHEALQNLNELKVRLTNAPLGRANLSKIDLQDANLQDANLVGTNLDDANLGGANLQGANLRDANLGGANLQGANLVGTNLEFANLKFANLKFANLKGATLIGTNLEFANLRDAILKGATLQDARLQNANLGGATLQDARLQNANLGGANLQGANLKGAQLQKAKYTDSTIFPKDFNPKKAGMQLVISMGATQKSGIKRDKV